MEYKLPKDYKKPNDCNNDFKDELYLLEDNQYNSPIKLIRSDLETQIENGVLKAVQEVGVDVNKEELVKALQYDRNQYEKGYADAKRQYDRGHGHWILEREPNGRPYCFRCSVCDDDFTYINITTEYEYCPHCGAIMDEEVEE